MVDLLISTDINCCRRPINRRNDCPIVQPVRLWVWSIVLCPQCVLSGSPIDFQKRGVNSKDDEMCKSNEKHNDVYAFFKMIEKCLEERFRDLDALHMDSFSACVSLIVKRDAAYAKDLVGLLDRCTLGCLRPLGQEQDERRWGFNKMIYKLIW